MSSTIGYGRQSIDADDVDAVIKVLRGEFLTCGPAVESFERAIAARCDAPHAVAVSNGTAALRLLYRAAGVGPGKRVGVPTITFAATAMQVLALGAEPVLLDVDPETLLLTPEIVEGCSERLDFLVPVHFAGRLCDLAALRDLGRRRGFALIEDAAHAFGSSWSDGRRCGDGRDSIGAAFSFHPVKNVTTAEGGAIVVRDSQLAARLRSLRHHGVARSGFSGELAAEEGNAPWYHEFHEVASNERLSDLHAALGLSQLMRLEQFKAERARIHDSYRRALRDQPAIRPAPPAEGQEPCWHLFVAQCDWKALEMTRREFFRAAQRVGFAPQVHYIPLHLQPVFERCVRAGDLSASERAYRRIVSLPCYPGIAAGTLDRIQDWLATLGSMVMV